MNLRRVARRILPPVVTDAARRARARRDARRFEKGGRVPWTRGYDAYRRRVLENAVADEQLLALVRKTGDLPPGHGVRVGERCVEYPWLLAHLDTGPGRVLDAGSALNHDFLVKHPRLATKDLTVLTLAPERHAFWKRGISYQYGDLRELPFRDAWFDTVACVSTLEHVGCDNTAYTLNPLDAEDAPGDFEAAMRELARVTRPGGTLHLTVPFGRYTHLRAFQQFDSTLLERAVAAFGPAREDVRTFYRYTPRGWELASEKACAEAVYAERHRRHADGAAGARAVACVRLVKGDT